MAVKTRTVVTGSSISARQLKDLFRQIDDGCIRGAHLQALLEHQNPFDPLTRGFDIWRTIRIGTGLGTPDDFLRALETAGVRVGARAASTISGSGFASAIKETELDLVNLSAPQLGARAGSTLAEISETALGLGLKLCPPEVGPQLRLQYLDQPIYEWLFVAMEPIVGTDGRPGLFLIERDANGLCLLCHSHDSGEGWRADSRFLFVDTRR